jgi:large subunit ribosomal protein L32
MPGIAKCPRCGKMKLNHRVCKACGYYDGQQIVETEAK